MKPSLGAVGLAAVLSLGGGLPAAAAAAPDAKPADAAGPIVTSTSRPFTSNDLLLFELSAAGHQLDDGFGAYGSRAGVFLPFGQLTRLLDLAVTVDAERGRADGWVLSQDRPLHLDLAAHKAQIGNRTVEFSDAQAALFQGDLYLRADLIEQLLPLTLKVDQASLSIEITPKAKLPFQERLERETRKGGLAASASPAEEVLKVQTPYRAFSPPAVDVNILAGGGNHGAQTQTQADVRVAGDLAFAGFQSYAGTDASGRLNDVRVLFERKDPQGQTVGIPGLTRADVGDTFTPGLLLGARSVAGRGVAVTTGPLEQANVFDKIDIRGELPAGWQAELYVNEVLRASQLDPVDGRYEFLQVSLVYGVNVIRVVLYGPRGERKEDVRRVNVGATSLAKGEAVFSFGAVQESTQVVNLQNNTAIGLGGAGDLRTVGQLAYGLGGGATVTTGVAAYTPTPNDHRTMGSLGLSGSLMGAAAEIDGAVDNHSGAALAFGLAGRPLDISIVARDSEYNGQFIDENHFTFGSEPLRRATNLNLAYTANLAGIGALPLSALIERDQFVTGGDRYSAQGQVSKPIGRYLVSGSLDYESTGQLTSSRQMTGSLDVSGMAPGNWQLRGSLDYQVIPDDRLVSALFTADKQILDRAALRLGLQKTFGPGAATELTGGLTYRFHVADLSLTGNWDTQRGAFSIGLQLSFSFAFDPLQKRYRAVLPGAATGGGVALDAFRDSDGDGVREPGEAGVQGLKVEGGRQPVTTDQQGHSLTTGLGDGAQARVHVDADDLGDPYISTPPEIIEIVPRPGQIAVVPYPIQATGEVELKFTFQRPGDIARGLSALSIQLIDEAGKVVAEGRTEYDGSLLLENLHRGTFQVRIEPAQAARLKLTLAAPVTVKVGSAGGFVGRISARVVTDDGKAAAPGVGGGG
jgi:hypothetical protein